MPLKSTNIWDDVRASLHTPDTDDPSHRHGRHNGVRSSLMSDYGDEPAELGETVAGGMHANRHGISMKSLTKTRRGH